MASRPRPQHTPGADIALRAATAARVGMALREIRRGTALARLRDLILAAGERPVELAGADLLAIVVQRGEPRMSELADALRVDASTATRAVARLERSGLVTRRGSPVDRRVVSVVATSAGVDAQEAMRDRYDCVVESICDGFDDEELTALATLLDRLVVGIDALATSTASDTGQPSRTHS